MDRYTQINAREGSVHSDICVVTLYCTLKRGHASWLLSCHGGTAICLQLFGLIQSGKHNIIRKEAKVRYDRIMCIHINGKLICFTTAALFFGLVTICPVGYDGPDQCLYKVTGVSRHEECLLKLIRTVNITLQYLT